MYFADPLLLKPVVKDQEMEVDDPSLPKKDAVTEVKDFGPNKMTTELNPYQQPSEDPTADRTHAKPADSNE